MGYETLQRNLQAFNDVLARINLRAPTKGMLSQNLTLTREFFEDKANLPENEWLAKWSPRLKNFYNAQIVLGRLMSAVATLRDQPDGKLRTYLKKIFSGDLTQGSPPDRAKDYFYEFWFASVLAEAGFTVALEEPDIIVGGNGLKEPLGIACKYPSSEKQIHDHLSTGYKQIRNQSLEGFVAVGIDQIVLKSAFPNGVNYIDFTQGDKHPLEVLQQCVNDATVDLVHSRAQQYPSEVPVDGLFTTLTMGGIYGNPPGFTFVTAVAMQCDAWNPIVSEIKLIHDSINNSRQATER